MIIKIIIILFLILFFDSFYCYLRKNIFKEKYITISIISNILELFYFRVLTLIFSNLVFTFENIYSLIFILFLIPHLFLNIKNFYYNHLYYFVPKFIDYPFDEFSSLFDIILLFIKIFLSISANTDNFSLSKFCFLILIISQIFFSFYFIYKLSNNSYLFMKNSFLNKTKTSLFLINTSILILALLFGRDEIITVLFLILCIGIIFIIMAYIYMIYNPFHYIKIKRETPTENMFFYLFILSNSNDLDFLIENKIKEHFEGCGLCTLCKKYIKYLEDNQTIGGEDEEKTSLIKNENSKNDNFDNKLMDLFHVLYDGKNKYFELIKKITINYKNRGKDCFKNNYYYYINLSFLIYNDYKKNNRVLSLNEKILLDVFNRENKLLDFHESQIKQILFCNNFINLGNKILTQLKDIINCEQNIHKVRKLLDLSNSLKEMKKPEYKNYLFSHKQENISNSRNLLMSCSIVYEEIFNTVINNSQIPIRDNIQPLLDIFHTNSYKIDRIISLLINLTNNNCKIVRVGKDLYSYKNYNLFDLFPLIFKEYQMNLILSNILEHFDLNLNSEKSSYKNDNNNEMDNKDTKKDSKENKKNIKTLKRINHNNKKNSIEYAETKVIICEVISSKIYYKLLTLKLSPLFNCNYNSYFILFDGTFLLHKNTLITLKDFEEGNNPNEKILAVSEPELEKPEIYYMTLQKYVQWQNNKGFIINKITKFNLSNKLYSIYSIEPKDKELYKKKMKRGTNSSMKMTKFEEDYEEEDKNIFHRNSKIEQLIEDNASVTSQQTTTNYSNGFSGLGIKNKKKDNIQEYNNLSKIRKIIYISIPIILICFIIEFIYFKIIQKYLKTQFESYFQFKELYTLYFQLFTSILGIVRIQIGYNSDTLISIYSNQFDFDTIGGYLNFSSYVLSQSKILSEKIMEKRNDLVNIHKNIGDKKYNQIFGQNIEYYRISQYFIKGESKFELSYINIQFSEALLMILNTYNFLTNNTYKNTILFLNKIDDPFDNLNKYNVNEITQFQKEIYEMIFNYKMYREQFNNINKQLFHLLLFSKSSLIEFYIYLLLNIDTLFMLFISCLLYLYLFYFENILIKILNFINMTINIKNDLFNFSSNFLKKIENLENILKIYKEDPVKSVTNLNDLYNKYQQYLSVKNKNNINEMNKKGYRKISFNENKKSEMDNIPKNQRIITKKEISKLHITSKYFVFLILILISFLGSYAGMMIMWYKQISRQKSLCLIIYKDFSLESSLYSAINIYDLMILNNYTLDELSKTIFINEPSLDNNKNSLLQSFYQDLELAFKSLRDKKALKKLYKIDNITNITCEMIYNNIINDTIKKIESGSKELNKINNNLVKMCEKVGIDESKDILSVFEYHFQFIKNAILSIDDFSYKGLVDHINTGKLGKITVFFNCVLIYILDILNNFPNNEAIRKLNSLLDRNIQITELIFIGLDFLIISTIFLIFISKIKNFCNQIYLLKKIFQIYESQDQ